MFAKLVAAVLVGAAGAGLGAALLAFVDHRTKAAQEVAKRHLRLGAVVGAIVSVSFANASGLGNRIVRFITPAPPMERLGEELLAIPEVALRLHGAAPADADAIVRQLAADGLTKLDDSLLITRARLVSNMLAHADITSCAGFARGTLDAASGDRLLASFSDDDAEAWAHISRTAVEAELGVIQATATARPDADAIRSALNELARSLPTSGDADRLLARLDSLDSTESIDSISDNEACWSVRTLYALMVSAEASPARATVARAMVSH